MKLFKWCLLSLVFGFSLQSCKNANPITFDDLAIRYSKNKSDSLKLQSLLFIKKNISDITSEKIQFYDPLGNPIEFPLDTVTSESSLTRVLLENQIYYKTYSVKDIDDLDLNLLDKNITLAVADWNNYAWNKNIPKEIFLNYLLPYKILKESSEDWRGYFSDRYSDSIKLFQKNHITNPVQINKSLRNDLFKEFRYSENFTKLSGSPSLTELLAVKKGECYHLSHLLVYANRAFGIPSTIDIVPLWGSKSGGHATDVFYQPIEENGTVTYGFRPMPGNNLKRPPKVFRMSFKRINLWSDSIQPLLEEKDDYVPNFLKSDHIIDVTSEYTLTADVVYEFKQPVKSKIAFICVHNYGKWKPLFHGKVIDNGKSAKFNTMSKDMAYQIAVPDRKGFKLIDRPFVVDSLGNFVYSKPEYGKRIDMNLQKVNYGGSAWVKRNIAYDLMILEGNHWKFLERKVCQRDSMINFTNVPINGFYMLQNLESSKKLERIFLYKNDKQVWY